MVNHKSITWGISSSWDGFCQGVSGRDGGPPPLSRCTLDSSFSELRKPILKPRKLHISPCFEVTGNIFCRFCMLVLVLLLADFRGEIDNFQNKVHCGLTTLRFNDTLSNGWIRMVMPTVHRGMIKENILIVKENISDDSMTLCSTITTDWSGFCCNLM